MKKTTITNITIYLLVLCLSFITFSCGGGEEESTEETVEETQEGEEEAKEETEEESTEEVKELEPGMTPFDFPTVSTKSEAGEFVLIPSYKAWTKKISAEDPTKETFIFYTAEMLEPGEIESKLKFTFDGEQMMPNSMIIPIKPAGTVKVGDIVKTWWQTGSGMQRAIVTDASNPQEPMVRYLDLDWSNPAKDKTSGKSIGQTEYKLKPNSFSKIISFSSGSTIAAKDDGKWKCVQVISMSQEADLKERKVLTLGFAGKMKVYSRKDCYSVPQVIDVKPGDKVKAEFVGSFKNATVKRIDSKMGVVFVEFENIPDEKPVSFGRITTTLPE